MKPTAINSKETKINSLNLSKLVNGLGVQAFSPYARDLSASTPRMWHTSMFFKLGGRYQPFRMNSKISDKVDSWRSSPSLRRETVAAGPSFSVDVATSCRPDNHIQDIHGSFGCGYEHFFILPLTRRGSGGHNYKVLQGSSHNRRRGLTFSVRVVKY